MGSINTIERLEKEEEKKGEGREVQRNCEENERAKENETMKDLCVNHVKTLERKKNLGEGNLEVVNVKQRKMAWDPSR